MDACLGAPIEVALDCRASFIAELRAGPGADASVLAREALHADLPELVEETFVRGVLGERLSADTRTLDVSIAPRGSAADSRPRAIAVRAEDDQGRSLELLFEAGRWVRRAQETALRLRAEGRLAAEQPAYVQVQVEPGTPAPGPEAPFLQAPPIDEGDEGTLEELDCGVLGAGELDPERPVLVSARMLEEILELTERAGPVETGGGTLGRILRLPEPLPGTRTRVVTVLTASFPDARHLGRENRFTFSPQALAEVAELAVLRGLGERVLTAFHSHGWGTACGRCNQEASCPLAACTEVSLDDYRVCESLFPGKATLLPIAGRAWRAPGQRPVLAVHAWQGGELVALPWRSCTDRSTNPTER